MSIAFFSREKIKRRLFLLHAQITIIDALEIFALRRAHVMRKKEMFVIVVRCVKEGDV